MGHRTMAKLNQMLEKLTIHNKDDKVDVVAYYNPKEVSLDRNVPWAEHPIAQANTHILEFTGAKPMTMSCELFCDLYEQRGNVDEAFVNPLLDLTRARPVANGPDRPPICIFVWGKNFRRFECIIESLAFKYTMFLPDGTPCRATATIKMKHVEWMGKKGGAVYDTSGNKRKYADVARGDYNGGTRGGL